MSPTEFLDCRPRPPAAPASRAEQRHLAVRRLDHATGLPRWFLNGIRDDDLYWLAALQFRAGQLARLDRRLHGLDRPRPAAALPFTQASLVAARTLFAVTALLFGAAFIIVGRYVF